MAAGGAGARPEDGGRSPSTASRAATGRARRKVLGLGFWVQGFRCFPWTAVNFYLKDGIKVAPATLQLLQNSANVPFVWKPLFGFLSDVVYIRGQHRLPYIAIGATASGSLLAHPRDHSRLAHLHPHLHRLPRPQQRRRRLRRGRQHKLIAQ